MFCVYLQKVKAVKQRIYIDTSVMGGYFDAEFAKDTVPFFESLYTGEWTVLLSDQLNKELENAPERVRELLKTFSPAYTEYVKMTSEAEYLANKYIEAGVVGKTSLTDCQHIAIATLYRADILVSWNFKHIVNLGRIRGYNGINLQQGYNTIEIRTPKEVMSYEPK
jgi:predicted nucleic acid-binding protein